MSGAVSTSSRWAAMRVSCGRPMASPSLVLGGLLVDSVGTYRRRRRELDALERERTRR